jgi:hypothetical protein
VGAACSYKTLIPGSASTSDLIQVMQYTIAEKGGSKYSRKKSDVLPFVNNFMSRQSNVDLATPCCRNPPLLESVVAAMLSYGRGGCCGVARVTPPIASDDPGDKAT